MSDAFKNFIPFILEGQVVHTEDPDQMGRVKVWVPALDGENFDIDHLPWAEYAPSFFGFTVDFPAGNGTSLNDSHVAYGMWAIPKIGATVFIFCVGGDPSRRAYFASSIRLHRNRSLPTGRNFDEKGNVGPFGDAGDGEGNLNKVQPAYDNLREQFQNKLTESEAISRGVYERQVAQAKMDKDGQEGYSKTPVQGEKYLDPQTYCWVTPGRHAIIMQDDPTYARLRVKTAEGHQIIFDDANERIYVSTSRGATWLELDLDGHVHVFGAQSISYRAGVDFNVYADGNINLEAGKGINMKANTADIRASAKGSIHLKAAKDGFFTVCGGLHGSAEGVLRLSSQKNMDVRSAADVSITGDRGFNAKAGESMKVGGKTVDFKSESGMKMSGSRIDLNGPGASGPRTADEASCGEIAASPSVVPGHEPWKRPATKGKRNKNWRA